MRNIALFLTYEGTAYHGWQMQKNLATVQQTLEKAISMVVAHSVHVTGCGRTDAGVHAKCYVANFRTTSTIPVERIPYALNTHLPVDIVVTKAFEVSEDFNAIGSCSRKEYTYLIYNSRVRDPFYVNRAWFYPKHLDEKVMQEAASLTIWPVRWPVLWCMPRRARSNPRRSALFWIPAIVPQPVLLCLPEACI